MNWESYQSKIPAGKVGNARVEKFRVKKVSDFLHAFIHGATVIPGEYTKLIVEGQLMMTDTHDEIMDQSEIITTARGRVLIHGLGLGITLEAVLLNPEVSSVDVVEKSIDVINLVAPHFVDDKRVRIWHDDCLTRKWPRGTRWDFVWHDIWPTICADNLPEIRTLHKKFAKRCGWQGSWKKEYLEDMNGGYR